MAKRKKDGRRNVGYRGVIELTHPQTGRKLRIKTPGRERSQQSILQPSNGKWVMRLVSAGGSRGAFDYVHTVLGHPAERFARLEGLLRRGWSLRMGDQHLLLPDQQPKAAGSEDGECHNSQSSTSGPTLPLGDQPKRGKRAGKKHQAGKQPGASASKEQKAGATKKMVKLENCSQRTLSPVWCTRPMWPETPEMRESATRSAQILCRIAGRLGTELDHPVEVPGIDYNGLAIAILTGQNPLPYLQADIERFEQPVRRILITYDSSGSCRDFSGLAEAWARALAKVPLLEIICIPNSNGCLQEGLGAPTVDLIIYLGDNGGLEIARDNYLMSQVGKTDMIYLSNHASNKGDAVLVRKLSILPESGRSVAGKLIHICRFHCDNPNDWESAMLIAEKILSQ